MTVTFKVDEVKPMANYVSNDEHHEPKNPFGEVIKLADPVYNSPESRENYVRRANSIGMKSLGVGKIEAWKMSGSVRHYHNPERNGFINTVYEAYNNHKSLTLDPDIVWIMVCQAVTKHITLNSEDARKAIVNFEGKKTLTIHRDSWIKGSPDNDWEGGFAEFSDQIAEYIGKKRDLFDPTFSTTTSTTKAAIQVQMMAALAPFFDYRAMTCCGIPTVTLLGTADDWTGILSRVQAFGEFYPSWAQKPLEEACQEFVNAIKGRPEMDFWQNLFKVRGGSGGTPINGIINVFFPYMTTVKYTRKANADVSSESKYNKTEAAEQNKTLVNGLMKSGAGSGYDLGDYGSAVAAVPLTWDYYGQEYKMKLAAGCFGYSEEGEGIRPMIGWAVGDDANG